MKRVYVTEGGYFNEYGQFLSTGVIGVDNNPKLAVSFPISVGCYRHRVSFDNLGFVITYKSACTDRGYRVTSSDLF